MTSTSKPMTIGAPYSEKLEKFNGSDFKCWRQKLCFYQTTLNLAKFFKKEAPTFVEGEVDKDKYVVVDVWKNANFLYKSYVLNGLDNTLYNVYSVKSTAKEMWESLDHKYKTELAKFKISN